MCRLSCTITVFVFNSFQVTYPSFLPLWHCNLILFYYLGLSGVDCIPFSYIQTIVFSVSQYARCILKWLKNAYSLLQRFLCNDYHVITLSFHILKSQKHYHQLLLFYPNQQQFLTIFSTICDIQILRIFTHFFNTTSLDRLDILSINYITDC